MEHIKNELAQLRKEHENLGKRIERIELNLKLAEPSKQETKPNTVSENLLPVVPTVEVEDSSLHTENYVEPKQKNDLEFRIGGTWLNRIGIIAVIFGLAYFLKYSFDNDWIGPVGRIMIGIFVGLIMIGIGEKVRNRFSGYAQGLLGGGSLAIFFSVFASYQFYELLSPLFALIFLFLIMISTVLLAIRHDSLPIGLLGIVGAYAVPIMIGSDDPSLWNLYTYFALVTCGVLTVSIYKKWTSFQYVSFAFNLFVFLFTWIGTSFVGRISVAEFWTMYLFLLFNFVMYLGIATIYNIRKQKKATSWDIVLNVINFFSFFGFSLFLLEDTLFKDYTGFYAVILALVYIYLGKWAHRLFKEDKTQVYILFLVSFVLITIAIPLQLSGTYITIAWFAEAVGLIYMARTLKIVKLVYSGLVVLLLGLIAFIVELELTSSWDVFLINVPTLLYISSLLTVAVIVQLLRGFEHPAMAQYKIAAVLKGLFLLLVFAMITFENTHFFTLQNIDYFLSPEQLSLSAVWLIYAIVLFAVGIRKMNKYLRYAALGLFAVIILKAFFIDLANLIALYKILLFIFLGLCLLGISYFYQKKKDVLHSEEEKS